MLNQRCDTCHKETRQDIVRYTVHVGKMTYYAVERLNSGHFLGFPTDKQLHGHFPAPRIIEPHGDYSVEEVAEPYGQWVTTLVVP